MGILVRVRVFYCCGRSPSSFYESCMEEKCRFEVLFECVTYAGGIGATVSAAETRCFDLYLLFTLDE